MVSMPSGRSAQRKTSEKEKVAAGRVATQPGTIWRPESRSTKNVLGRTQGEANPKAAIEEIKGLDVTMTGKYIVGAWMDEWFKNYAKIKVRPSSHHAYQGYIDNHIKPDIGEVPLEKLTSLELQKICKKLLNSGRIDRVESKRQPRGLSPKTVRNICQIIASAMKPAKE